MGSGRLMGESPISGWSHRASFHNEGYGKAGVRGVPPGAGPRLDNSAVIRRAERSGLPETEPPQALLEPTVARARGG
jgi:hypothetical protein